MNPARPLDHEGARRADLAAILEHLRTCVRASQGAAARQAKRPLTPRQAKVWALWMQLADAGLVRQRTSTALAAYIKRMTQVDRLEFLNGPQLDLVIEALKLWLRRRQEPVALPAEQPA